MPPGGSGLSAVLRGDRNVFRLVYEFNLLPARSIHVSWAETIFTEGLWKRLASTPRCEAPLSRMILDELGLSETFPFDFSGPAARLTLLDSPTLDRLALYAGLVAGGSAVRQVIERDGVNELRQSLGDAAYNFALVRAPLLEGACPGTVSAEGGPDAAHCRSADDFRAIGRRLLAAVVAGLPGEIVKRFVLKLPFQAAPIFAKAAHDDRAQSLIVRIIREAEPKWAFLFAPTTA